jgi:hypothetical protein
MRSDQRIAQRHVRQAVNGTCRDRRDVVRSPPQRLAHTLIFARPYDTIRPRRRTPEHGEPVVAQTIHGLRASREFWAGEMRHRGRSVAVDSPEHGSRSGSASASASARTDTGLGVDCVLPAGRPARPDERYQWADAGSFMYPADKHRADLQAGPRDHLILVVA